MSKFQPTLSASLEDDTTLPQMLFETKAPPRLNRKFKGVVKAVLTTKLAIETQVLPAWLVSEFRRLVTFANPEFFKNEHLRKSNWNTPRHIVRGEMLGTQMIIPRGVLDKADLLVIEIGGLWDFLDKRPEPQSLEISILFKAKLREY